jgi:hypothetical protein
VTFFVIPRRFEEASPESRDSGSSPSDYPGMTQLRIPAAQNARVADQPPSAMEGAGNAGCSMRTRSLACEKTKAHERSHHRFAETFRHSLHDGFTVSFVLSLVSRAFLPPSPARSSPRRLDISVGISRPHDFAVRVDTLRLAHHPRPSHPASNTRDDRPSAPLIGHGTREEVPVICPSPQGCVPATHWHDGQIR